MSTTLLMVVLASSASTSTTTLTLADYVATYHARNNRLRARVYDVEIEDVEIRRQTTRATRELALAPKIGGHLYHLSNPSGSTALAEFGGGAAYTVRGDTGIGYEVRADVNVPTAQNTFAGNLQYAVDGTFFMPLIRNLGGREFAYQRGAAEARRDVAEADVAYERLLTCADAVERYARRYAAQEKRAAFERLLKEKRRIWYRTASDYQKKLTTRLDLLSAKSDWLLARSIEPTIALEWERANAALVAYAPAGMYVLEPPPNLGVSTPTAAWARHPRLEALAALVRSFEQEVLVAREENRSELDLQLSAGVGRIHDLFVPPGRFSDLTDVRGTVGLRYLLPIERPDTQFRQERARLRMRRIKEEQALAVRELSEQATAQRAARAREIEVLALLDEQIDVLRSQINAAYQEFRSGKLEFQNYLDHWDRYQQARLQRWDRWLAATLAEVALVRVNGELPEVCRASTH